MEFWHPSLDVRLDFYLYGWTTYRIMGIDLLLGLAEIGVSMRFLRMLFHRMTTEENLPYLVDEIQSYDFSVLPTKEALYLWLFL